MVEETEQDRIDREKMLDAVEHNFYKHAGKRLLKGKPAFPRER